MPKRHRTGRYGQLARILCARSLLEANRRGFTAQELHRALGERGHRVALREIYRDLEFLRASGQRFAEVGEERPDSHARVFRLEALDRNGSAALGPAQVETVLAAFGRLAASVAEILRMNPRELLQRASDSAGDTAGDLTKSSL